MEPDAYIAAIRLALYRLLSTFLLHVVLNLNSVATVDSEIIGLCLNRFLL